MPLRLHSFAAACPQGGGALAAGGLGGKAAGAGLGLGPCVTTGGMAKAVGGGLACPQGTGALAVKGLGGGMGAKSGIGLGLGLGSCGTAGNAALGGKGATTVAWTTGGTAATGGASTHGVSLGLGLGLGAWGPVLLGLSVVGLGYYLYANHRAKPGGSRGGTDELAAALNGFDA